MKRISACILLFLLLFTGCQAHPVKAPEKQTLSLFAMDTFMEMQVYGDEALLAGAAEMILDLDARLSVTAEESEIHALNAQGHAVVSEDTAALVQSALALCARTDGALDISIYPVVRAWGFTTEEHTVPDEAALRVLCAHVDYTRISLSGQEIRLDDGMEIDLGSVAKGYTSTRVLDFFRENGAQSALLNLGGNVHALGAKPDGSPWRVAVQDPLGEGLLCALEIENKAVITSGGYERYFVEDGVTYWHILDPKTGAPAHSGLISVTIVGENGLVCDGLSTALFVMGLEDAAALWRESGDFEAIFVTEDKQVYITEGIADICTLLGDYAQTSAQVIRRG